MVDLYAALPILFAAQYSNIFEKLSQGELEAHLGFEGINAELELAKEEYEATQRMAQKLQVLLERDFSN